MSDERHRLLSPRASARDAGNEPAAAGEATAVDRPLAGQAPPQTVQGPGHAATVLRHADPTRYGDWELGGRCVDF